MVVELGAVELPGGIPAYQPVAGFTLSDGDWIEEKVFDRKRFSSLYVDIEVPVLVMRDVVGDINQLVISITQDMTTPADDAPLIDMTVADDGSFTLA